MRAEAIILMYHDLSTAEASPEQSPYVVPPESFRLQLERARSAGFATTTVGRWVQNRRVASGGGRPHLVFTFDDGDVSNYGQALPLLLASGYTATFFVTVGRIGTAGMLDWSQIAELHRAGMEIGSHTMTHRPPPLLTQTELRYEVTESKARLEDRLAAPVTSLSSPTGFFDRRMSDVAREAGYAAVCVGRMAPARRHDSTYNLPRIAIKRSCTLADFDKVLRLDPPHLLRLRGEQIARNALKTALGPKAYLTVRRVLLQRRTRQ